MLPVRCHYISKRNRPCMICSNKHILWNPLLAVRHTHTLQPLWTRGNTDCVTLCHPADITAISVSISYVYSWGVWLYAKQSRRSAGWTGHAGVQGHVFNTVLTNTPTPEELWIVTNAASCHEQQQSNTSGIRHEPIPSVFIQVIIKH